MEILQTPRQKKLQDMLNNVQSKEETQQLVDNGEREEKPVVFDESEPADEENQEKLFGE